MVDFFSMRDELKFEDIWDNFAMEFNDSIGILDKSSRIEH